MCRETPISKEKMSNSLFVRYRNTLRLLMVASGICCSYWLYGFFQEKLMTKSRLGATFILLVQTIANIIIAVVWKNIETRNTRATTKSKTMATKLNHPLMFLTSACYVFAMIGSNESLRFVSYPVAVLAKSCKLIPTMVMGSLIERRRYQIQQWAAAICISAGIALFNYSRMPSASNTTTASSSTNDDNHYWKGMVLLCISLCMDGFLGACQGMLKRQDVRNIQRPPTAVETMMYVNIYSLFFLFPLAGVSGQLGEGIRLLKDSEQLRMNLTILNGVVSVGQIFIFLCISWYSSLVTTTITTTRKFFTILFSVLYFGHSFTVGQWTSVLLVFGGLYLSIVSGNKSNIGKSVADSKKKD